MPFAKFPNSIKQVIITTIVVSAITGGLVGGVVGVIAAGWAGSSIWPYISQSLGIDNISSTKSVLNISQEREQLIVESSATIDVVQSATGSVVSIVVTQDFSELYNLTGPLSPLDEFYFFGSPFFQQPPPTGKAEREVRK